MQTDFINSACKAKAMQSNQPIKEKTDVMAMKKEEEIDQDSSYDRESELKAFDESKAGVKGLVDAGVWKLRRMFVHDHYKLHRYKLAAAGSGYTIPTIDLRDERGVVVDKIREACESWGFFQVVNHGVPARVLEEIIDGIRGFHEQDAQLKQPFYSMDMRKKVCFNSNYDLYRASAADWRDLLSCAMAPHPPLPQELPKICREIIMEYSKQVKSLGNMLLELFSEALGLKPNHLEDIKCAEKQIVIGNYQPACPQPELTLGNRSHTDSGFLTLLLVDQLGGLQILHHNQWVDVPPLPGALIVNVGDLLQLISNDKFRSVTHRVLAKREGPRTSVACFFSPDPETNTTYGPIDELITEGNPPHYVETSAIDYMKLKFSRGKDGASALHHIRM